MDDSRYCFKISPSTEYATLDERIGRLKAELLSVGVASKINGISKAIIEFMDAHYIAAEADLLSKKSLHVIHNHVKSSLNEFSTKYARKKALLKNSNHISPVEKGIGFRWEMRPNNVTGKPSRQMVCYCFFAMKAIQYE